MVQIKLGRYCSNLAASDIPTIRRMRTEENSAELIGVMARYCAGTADIHPWGSGVDQMVSFSFSVIPHHGGMKQNGDCRRQQDPKNF